MSVKNNTVINPLGQNNPIKLDSEAGAIALLIVVGVVGIGYSIYKAMNK